MLITQIGDRIHLVALISEGGEFSLAFQGTVINGARKPEGEAQCSSLVSPNASSLSTTPATTVKTPRRRP